MFIDDDGTIAPGASVMMEYIDEIGGAAMGAKRLIPTDPRARIEVRRLFEWFTLKLDAEATSWLVQEKILKRQMPHGGAPDMDALRAARTNMRHHMRYIDALAGLRRWFAGDQRTYPDFAAAHLSCADYLDEVPWSEHAAAKEWYQRLKSRSAFRSLLADRVPGMAPAAHNAEIDI